MVTPSKRTRSLAVIVSSPSRSGGPLLPSKVEPYLEPAQRSSVLSAFNLSLFAAIQCLTSVIHISSPAVWETFLLLTDFYVSARSDWQGETLWFLLVHSLVCPYIHFFILLLPNLRLWYFENESQFWCKLVHGARTWNHQLWGSRGQRSGSHDAEDRFRARCTDLTNWLTKWLAI